MLIDWRKIQGLPVYTVSGNRLGEMSSIVLDVESNIVFQYEVRTRFIGGRTFLINPEQIIEWQTDRIVVEDSMVKNLNSFGFAQDTNS